MRQTIQEALIGKTLTGFVLEPDGSMITFQCLEGDVRLEAMGDCCSESWIESVDDPGALRGRILDVEEVDLPDAGDVGTPKHPEVDSVAYYACKITTEHGRAVLDYRNDSNGYYGGSLEVKT